MLGFFLTFIKYTTVNNNSSDKKDMSKDKGYVK